MATASNGKYLTTEDLEAVTRLSKVMATARARGQLLVKLDTSELLDVLKRQPNKVTMIAALDEMNSHLVRFKPYGLKLLYAVDVKGNATDLELSVGRIHTSEDLLGMRPGSKH